jgi:hypothetical protein
LKAVIPRSETLTFSLDIAWLTERGLVWIEPAGSTSAKHIDEVSRRGPFDG